MKNILTILALILSIGLVGCGEDTGWTKVTEDDPRLEAAREQARETYPEFLKALKKRGPYDIATVEVLYEGTEYITLTVVKADENEITGVVENYPKEVNLQKGTQITVPVDTLSDWVIDKEDGEMLGGYVRTERVRLTRPGN